MKCSRNCKRIDLEKLNLDFKHADYMFDCGDLVVVVEVTSRSKLEDVDKLDNTIRWLYNQRESRGHSNFVGILHCFREVSPHVSKSLSARMQRARKHGMRVTYKTASCEDHLKHSLRKYNIIC